MGYNEYKEKAETSNGYALNINYFIIAALGVGRLLCIYGESYHINNNYQNCE